MSNAFDVRYVKLHFTLQFTEDTIMPVYKSSAIRGGIGEMLLRANCVRDRKCDQCDFESECIVRRALYPKMEIQPAFMSQGDSIGYSIECEDYHDNFKAGDTIRFNLLLFGKTIVFFNQFLNALYSLGIQGIGKEKSHYLIQDVTNSIGKSLLDHGNILMGHYEIQKINDYIEYRMKQLSEADIITIQFQSPVSLRYNKEELKEFTVDAVFESLQRRMYMLDCLEGIPAVMPKRAECDYSNVCVLGEEHVPAQVRRYSNHQNSAMYLRGISGKLVVTCLTDEQLRLLAAGEIIHVGKAVSFGFGRYRLFPGFR